MKEVIRSADPRVAALIQRQELEKVARELFKRRLANMTDIKHPPHRYLIFALGKVFYFGSVVLVPILILPLPWWQVLLGYLAMTAAASLVFVFLLIGTHFSDAAEFPAVTTDGSVGHTWAMHNLLTACDWFLNVSEGMVAGL